MKIRVDYVPQGSNTWDHTPIIEHRAIVLHDPGNTQNMAMVEHWIRSGKGSGSYHEIIEGQNVVELAPYNARVVHGAFFGGVEYNKEFFGTIAERGMQNRYTYGLCVTRPLFASWDTLVMRLTYWCNELKIHPSRITCHYHIDPGKTDPQYFYDNPAELDRLRLLIERRLT